MVGRMRIGICNVQVPFIKGGAEILSLELYNELIKRGHDVELINIPFKWYPSSKILKHALIWRMMDLTESNGEKIDLLICTKFPSYVIKHPNKVVWLFHQYRQAYELYDLHGRNEFGDGADELRDKIIKIDNKTIGECKKIYSISKNVSKRLRNYNNIKAKHIYPPPKNANEFYCGDVGDYFIYPSRIDQLKRQYLLIEAMKHVQTNVKVVIVGTGPQEKECKSLVQKLKVSESVQLYGYASDDELINLYANSLGVFYAPYDEDYGYVTIEAFLSKKPVITTHDSGGPLEFVEDDVNGYIVDPDPRDIAEKMDHLFKNKDVAEKMGQNGYKKVKSLNLSWDNVIKELVGE
jgi:glycosyltransferase involved in cell wall biosynthesis